jgi:putative membrane protein
VTPRPLAGVGDVGPSSRALWWGWRPDVAALLVAAILLGWYFVGVWRLSRAGLAWPVRRGCAWFGGVVALLFVTVAGPGRYGGVLLWIFTVQVVTVLLVVPVLLAYGRPLTLRTDLSGAGAGPRRAERSRLQAAVGVATTPLVGPVVVPVTLSVVYFTPVLSAALSNAPIRDLVLLVLLAIGAVVAAGLVGRGEAESGTSLALTAAIGLGLAELLLDAIPGIVVTLHAGLITSASWAGRHRSWAPSPHQDQTHAGAVLWAVAEVADIPFLIVLARRLMRADALEAARADRRPPAQPDHGAQAGGFSDVAAGADTELPWWQVDREQLRGHLLYRPPTGTGSDDAPR